MKPLVFLIAIIGGLSVWTQVQDKSHSAQSAATPTSEGAGTERYIPINLEDCFRQIDQAWNTTSKARIRTMGEDDFCASEQLNAGVWMRTNWLPVGERLAKYFNELGLVDAADMSDIILRSYHRYLNKRDIEITKQIQHIKDLREHSEAHLKAL